jgi:asparagine synthase (glutamine-hydrolysing)
VAFAHIDCDWYDSVKTSLERITPNLSSGGILVIDDYYAYSGCKKAVDEFLEKNPDLFIIQYKSRLHLQRK